MFKSKNFVRFQLPLILWAALIFIESSIPGNKFPSTPLGSDKLVHITIYFIFCWLAFRMLSNQSSKLLSSLSLYLSAVMTIVYGFSDEFHQLFTPGRSADMYDLAADALGGFHIVIAAFNSMHRGKRSEVKHK